MVKYIVFLLALFLFHLNNLAQTNDSLSKPKIQFASKNEFGVLIGIGTIEELDDIVYPNNERMLELTSSNGIQYGPLFVGLGVGIRKWDTEYTIPLFFSTSVNLWKNKNSLFLHTELGHQFGNRQANYFGNKENSGFLAAYGLGYDLSVAKRMKLYLKTSICHQLVKTGELNTKGPEPYLESYKLSYLFFRISLGLNLSNN